MTTFICEAYNLALYKPCDSGNAICIGYQSCATPVISDMENYPIPQSRKKRKTSENLRYVNSHQNKQKYYQPIHQPRSSKKGFSTKKTQHFTGQAHSKRRS